MSKEERDKYNLHEEKSLIYGEVEYQSFFKVLRKINPRPGGTFYDLGSGTGRAVIASRITRDFSRCIGIEILSGLHAAATTVVKKFKSEFQAVLNSSQDQQVEVYHGSFLEFDWSDGDLVFANSTCYDDKLMIDISKMAERLKPGSIFVTFTKGLTSSKFELLEKKRYKMSWGPATVFIHRRLSLGGSPIGPRELNILPSDSVAYEDDDDKTAASFAFGVPDLSDDDEYDYDDDEQDDDGDDYNDNSYEHNLVGESKEVYENMEDEEDEIDDDETVETSDSSLVVTGKAIKRSTDLSRTSLPTPSQSKCVPGELHISACKS